MSGDNLDASETGAAQGCMLRKHWTGQSLPKPLDFDLDILFNF